MLFFCFFHSGGLELLFNKVKAVDLRLPAQQGGIPLRDVLHAIRDELLKERPELFLLEDTVYVTLFLDACSAVNLNALSEQATWYSRADQRGGLGIGRWD